MQLTIEYFRFRMDHIDEQKKLEEESEILRLKNAALLKKLNNYQK